MEETKKKDFDFLEEFNFKDPFDEKDILAIEKFLERAYDIRKFEIEMYWKRATYFWGFIAASYTAFFLVSASKLPIDNKESNATLMLLITSLGLVFSYGWYISNRGSKYWTKNWHEIIDFLEAKLKKPFHRLNMVEQHSLFNVFSLYRFSVTNTNLIISFFNTAIWAILFALTSWSELNFCNNLGGRNGAIFILTTTTLLILTFQKQLIKSHKKDIVFR